MKGASASLPSPLPPIWKQNRPQDIGASISAWKRPASTSPQKQSQKGLWSLLLPRTTESAGIQWCYGVITKYPCSRCVPVYKGLLGNVMVRNRQEPNPITPELSCQHPRCGPDVDSSPSHRVGHSYSVQPFPALLPRSGKESWPPPVYLPHSRCKNRR